MPSMLNKILPAEWVAEENSFGVVIDAMAEGRCLGTAHGVRDKAELYAGHAPRQRNGNVQGARMARSALS